MVIKFCCRHGYWEQRSDLSDLLCAGCQEVDGEEGGVRP